MRDYECEENGPYLYICINRIHIESWVRATSMLGSSSYFILWNIAFFSHCCKLVVICSMSVANAFAFTLLRHSIRPHRFVFRQIWSTQFFPLKQKILQKKRIIFLPLRHSMYKILKGNL